MKAKVADIFCSTQGEGIYAGKTQLFVRFYGCRQNCSFCDTPLSAFDKYAPLELYRQVQRFTQPYHSLCLTGGEPLLHREFLKGFLKLVKYDGITTYLETNGILANAIEELIDDIDIVAMDFKLPSSTGMRPYWSEHKRFLQTALKKDVFIKMVISQATRKQDIDEALGLMLEAKARHVPLVVQPNFFELSKELMARTRMIAEYCLRRVSRVELIPQLHKITGVK